MKYGNIVSLMDAAYKITKYELPLFFICVKINVGYSTVPEFITQFETASHIEEALSILKKWNPTWCPSYACVTTLTLKFQHYKPFFLV